ncbi:hypothetical protein Trydic_g7780 [Trypoxylus dichotomus]
MTQTIAQIPTTVTQTTMTDQQAVTSKSEAERHAARKTDTTRAIRMLQELLQDVSDTLSSDMEYSVNDSTIGNTSDDVFTQCAGFRPPSRRQQRKRKGSRNSDSDTNRRRRLGTKLEPTGGQSVPATAPNLRTKEDRLRRPAGEGKVDYIQHGNPPKRDTCHEDGQ